MMCEALAREISHQEVINLFIASYSLTPSEKHDSASNIGNISVTSDGTLQTVVGMINPADSFAIRIDGTGPDIASAVVRGLHFMKDVNAAAKIHHTQRLSGRFDGKYCVLATCVEGDKTTWGYFIDENEGIAQAMAFVSASLVSCYLLLLCLFLSLTSITAHVPSQTVDLAAQEAKHHGQNGGLKCNPDSGNSLGAVKGLMMRKSHSCVYVLVKEVLACI